MSRALLYAFPVHCPANTSLIPSESKPKTSPRLHIHVDQFSVLRRSFPFHFCIILSFLTGILYDWLFPVPDALLARRRKRCRLYRTIFYNILENSKPVPVQAMKSYVGVGYCCTHLWPRI